MTYGRNAFGPQRRMSQATKAKNIAFSILRNGLDEGAVSTWTRYCIETNVTMMVAVRQAITAERIAASKREAA